MLLVRGLTCQENITLIPQLSARNNHQGRHTWLPWFSYLSGELHAWTKSLITLCMPFSAKKLFTFRHTSSSNLDHFLHITPACKTMAPHCNMQSGNYPCVTFFRRNTRCPLRKFAESSRLTSSRWVCDIWFSQLVLYIHGVRQFFQLATRWHESCLDSSAQPSTRRHSPTEEIWELKDVCFQCRLVFLC